MSKENAHVARHELIGLRVRIESRAAGHDGREGTVVDETKNTLLVESETGSLIRIPKAGNRFVFRVGNERFVVVEGDEIRFRPEDRTKKVRG